MKQFKGNKVVLVGNGFVGSSYAFSMINHVFVMNLLSSI